MEMSNDVETILQRANIADVIGKYIEIQKKGNNYVSICPFHNDSAPSLNISVDKKIFKCFSCGVGGNAIGFVQRYKSLTFPEALNIVGAMVGVDIKINKVTKSKYNERQTKILSINNDAANYFTGILFSKGSDVARNYLDERKISLDQIREYDIGFAKGKYHLYEFLKETRGYSDLEIEASSLFIKKGLSYFPVFRDRLIFPIRDIDGKVIGFSGRVVDPNDSPKYLNTAENDVFKKSHLAYNLNKAESAIRMKDEIIILEGYMDVISLNSINIKNVIAIMGTTLSDYHVEQFQKLTRNFTLFLDGDEPGIAAALKISKKLFDYDVNVKIILNNTSLDPDELIRQNESKKVLQMIDNAKSPEEFVLDYAKRNLLENDSIQARDAMMNIVFEQLLYSKNNVHDIKHLTSLATILNTDFKILNTEFEKFRTSHKQLPKINKTKKIIDEPIFISDDDYESENNFFIPNNDDEFSNETISNIYKPPVVETKNILMHEYDNLSKSYVSSIYMLINIFANDYNLALAYKDILALIAPKYYGLVDKVLELKLKNADWTMSQIVKELKSEDNNYIYAIYNDIKKKSELDKYNLDHNNLSNLVKDPIKIIRLTNINSELVNLQKAIEEIEKNIFNWQEQIATTANDDVKLELSDRIENNTNNFKSLQNAYIAYIEKRGKIYNGN